MAALSALQSFVSCDDLIVEFDHEGGALVPVDGDFGRKSAVGEDRLHYPGIEGCTVQGAVLPWNGDVRVDQGLLLDDVVGLVVIVSLLQLVCLFAKQGSPHRHL